MAPRLAITVMALCLIPVPGTAGASTGPCLPGQAVPTCQTWTGTVGPVDDGDTINVDIGGDGSSRRYKIRLTGIQAMELSSYSRKQGRRGECHAVAATTRLEKLIRRGRSRVRLSALDANSKTGGRNRLRRSVAVRRSGRWVDAGAEILRAGLALWLPNGQEWAPNAKYSRLAADAAARGIGLWNTRACGAVGPSQASPLSMRIQWDANGTDSQNVNGEWARITNPDTVNAVSLAGWWFRDSYLRRYTFPTSARIEPGGSIWVHMGNGRNTAQRFYWGQDEPVFENTGDGAYLFDRDGDLRSWVQYPCRVGCYEPLADKLSINASYWYPEYVTIRNVSSGTVSLNDYELESSPWFYTFASDAVLPAGRAIVLWIDSRPRFLRGFSVRSVELQKEWGFDDYLLSDNRDAVTLRNPMGAPVVCDSWGGDPCPQL